MREWSERRLQLARYLSRRRSRRVEPGRRASTCPAGKRQRTVCLARWLWLPPSWLGIGPIIMIGWAGRHTEDQDPRKNPRWPRILYVCRFRERQQAGVESAFAVGTRAVKQSRGGSAARGMHQPTPNDAVRCPSLQNSDGSDGCSHAMQMQRRWRPVLASPSPSPMTERL